MSFMKSNGLMTAALLLSLGTMNAFAQQDSETAGIVRISDGRVRSNIRQASNQQVDQMSGCRNGSCQSGNGGGGSCPTGGCPTGQYQNGSCPTGQCPQCRGRNYGPGCQHYCTHSPDYGYSPPDRIPLHRRGVEYTNYFPAQWYGAGADYSQSRAPMVYMPTDTTQMGFYYQHVPFWRPQPERLPERPIPAQWHTTAPSVQTSRYCGPNCPGYMGPYAGCQYRSRRLGRYSQGNMMGGCPIETGWCPQGPAQSDGSVAAQVTPTPIDQAPQPVTNGSPEPLPQGTAPYDEGSEPNALPQSPTADPAPN